MKKFQFDKKIISYSIYFLIVICIAITYEKILGNVNPIFKNFSSFFNIVIKVLAPFLYGFFIAYLLNSLLKFIENKIIGKIKFFNERKKYKRVISALLTISILVGVIVWIIAYLVPEITKNLNLILISIQKYFYTIQEPLREFFEKTPTLEEALDKFNKFFNKTYEVSDLINSLGTLPFEIFSSLGAIPNAFNNFISFALNTVLGIMIAFYSLCDKETMTENSTKIIYALFKKSHADKILFFCKEANLVFEKYIVGKALDSLIIGTIFFIGGFFLKLPFLPIISLVIFITNMIPYFGPFLGAIPVVLLVLLDGLIQGSGYYQAIWTTIFITILQQIDGIIIGPKILGDSTGLRPIEVIFSIIVGGATFNVLGMFLGVPVFALIKNLFYDFIDKRYEDKKEILSKEV